MKFSGGTGVPASRRSSASWPAWVIASENGPCSSCAGVIPWSVSPLSRCAASAATIEWKRRISAARSGSGSGQ